MGGRRFSRLPQAMREEVIEQARSGKSERSISRSTSVPLTSVRRVLQPLGGVIRVDLVQQLGGQLSLDDRFEIWAGRKDGETLEAIAVRLGRHKSTVCRELQRCPVGRYRPVAAHRLAVASSKRPKPTKLAANPLLCAAVIDGLRTLWSPEQISRVLAELHPKDPTMNISPETIYKSLFVQARGELNRELARCLRTGRAIRRQQHRHADSSIGKIPDMVMIADRLARSKTEPCPGTGKEI